MLANLRTLYVDSNVLTNPDILSIFNFNFYVIGHPHEGAFQNQYTPNPPSQLSLWEETGVPGENPRLSAER